VAMAQSQNEGYSPHLINRFVAEDAAKTLIDYKYLFLTAPSLNERLQEAATFAKTLKPSQLTVKGFSTEINKMNREIAQALFNTALQDATVAKLEIPQAVATKVTADLQKGLQYQAMDGGMNLHYQGKPLDEFIATLPEQNLKETVINAVSQVLQKETQAISIKEVGKYQQPRVEVMQAPVEPEPRKKHGLKKILGEVGDAIKHIGREVLRNGIGTQIESPHIFAGLNNQNMYKIFSFHKEPEVLFKIKTQLEVQEPTRTQSNPLPIAVPQLAVPGVNLKVISNKKEVPFPARVVPKPFPKVIPLPWENAKETPAKPLIFSRQAQSAMLATQRVTRSQARLENERNSGAAFKANPLAFDKTILTGETNLKSFTVIEPFSKSSIVTHGDLYNSLSAKGLKINKNTLKEAVEWADTALKGIGGNFAANRLWSRLTELEKEFSIGYVDKLKPKKSRFTNE
jgi:hypothetical protein